jgi:hypothetical protein
VRGMADDALEGARRLTRAGDDETARLAYLEVVRSDPTNVYALIELGNLALAGGFRSAAKTAYAEAIKHHPGNAIARINLANLLRADDDSVAARSQYEAALAIDANMHEAHQGMAWVLKDIDRDAAERHLQKGFAGRALVTQPYRGTEVDIPLLLLVCARGGNIPTDLWINDRRFTVHALYPEFYDTRVALPPHALVVNAIGDADLCAVALSRCKDVLAHSRAPIINQPMRVQPTGRAQSARRLGAIAGVIAPRIEVLHPKAILVRDNLQFPLLLRRPGFHTGEHFIYVASRDELPSAIDALSAADGLLLIPYLDARGADGMWRKYRVMFVDGVLYPLHLPPWRKILCSERKSGAFSTICRPRLARVQWKRCSGFARPWTWNTPVSISRSVRMVRFCSSRRTRPWWCFPRVETRCGTIAVARSIMCSRHRERCY